ncbi:MAG: methyltransferase [marine bacterium B5-7]|nr:MAG: methyltransferase [marine bacterium B5-7]
MTESWDACAAGWDDNKDVINYSSKAFVSLRKVVDLTGLRIFDFGCGTGLLTERMAEYAERITALDPSAKMIAVLESKKLSNVDTIVGEITEKIFDLRPGLVSGFDLVVASSVCAFLDDYQLTLALLKRLLKPNGLFVQWDWLKSDKCQTFGFTENQLLSAFKQAGMTMLSVSTPFSLVSEGGEMEVLMGVGMNA